MRRLIWFIIILSAAFAIQAIFAGGDYVRFAGERLGVKAERVEKIADFADTFRLDAWMAEKSAASRNAEKRRLGN
jgi:hypothetical protein